MSTRCQIGFYPNEETSLSNFESLIYRHSDGYPGKSDGTEYGVLADIMPFLNQYPRTGDIEYCSARLLQYLCNIYDGGSTDKFTGEIGYGISNAFHGDIEYFYAIHPNKVKVYSCSWDSKQKSLIETILINPIEST